MKPSKITHVRIISYDDHDERFENENKDQFWVDYKNAGDKYRVTYGTTAAYKFCQNCGSFDCRPGCQMVFLTEKEVFDAIEKEKKYRPDSTIKLS